MVATAEKDLPDITEGDEVTYKLDLDDGDTQIDITGWTVWFTVKEFEYDDDSDAIIQKKLTNHDDPANGVTIITLSSSETSTIVGEKYYDIQVKRDDDSIQTLVKGHVEFVEGITDSVD